MKYALLLITSMLVSGCSTMVGMSSSGQCDREIPRMIYTGTVGDANLLWSSIAKPSGSSVPQILYGVIDLPFSFVADTLILPYTVPCEFVINKHCNSPKLQRRTKGFCSISTSNYSTRRSMLLPLKISRE